MVLLGVFVLFVLISSSLPLGHFNRSPVSGFERMKLLHYA